MLNNAIERQTIGILIPMEEEIELLLSLVEIKSEIKIASRTFFNAQFAGKNVVLVKSGIGKVASSFTASLLIHKFGVKSILVTGIAGGIADHVKVGDIAIAIDAVQHDMDCRPLFPQFEVPFTNKSFFKSDPNLTSKLESAAKQFVDTEFDNEVSLETMQQLGIELPKIYLGRLASGDQFIGTFNQWEKIRADVMDTLFVEMEGAAVAQVCHDSGIPWCSIRTISDKSNAMAHVDFNLFLHKAAKIYTAGIVKKFIELL
ncbi:MAG: 5'-methylthioadenosine/adenosylhomocysteine nucleosidase [Opitutaceae bacterium]|nr:5'-methylthioadenosine/adenosylhomocysteine nucleosidase [Cytophagales bacterium]